MKKAYRELARGACVAAGFLVVTATLIGCARVEPAAGGFALPEDFATRGDSDRETVITIVDATALRGDVSLDLDAIVSLPPRTFTAFDPWLEEERSQTGVHLGDLLDALDLGAAATEIVFHARNDYEVSVPLDHVRRFDYLLAYAEEGCLYADLPEGENKGPLAVAIDFDRFRELDPVVTRFHNVWWLDEITLQ